MSESLVFGPTERPVTPDTVFHLLFVVNEMVGGVPVSPYGVRSGLFVGVNEPPAMFAISQIPIDVGTAPDAPYHIAGQVAKIEARPIETDTSSPQGDASWYSFYHDQETGLVDLRKGRYIPAVPMNEFVDSETERADMRDYRLANERRYRTARQEEQRRGLDIVSEREARNLYFTLRDAIPDPAFQLRVEGLMQEAERLRQVQRVGSWPWTKRFIRKLLG